MRQFDYVVWFIGFQPGFPYLGSLPELLHTPDVRNRVCLFRQVLSVSVDLKRGSTRLPHLVDGN